MKVVLFIAQMIGTALIVAAVPIAIADTLKRGTTVGRVLFCFAMDVLLLGSLLLTLAHAWGWL